MATLQNKIDFIGFISVNHANPNGDPLCGNQPRTDYDGYGEISDVCIKRKIRNRLQDMGERILIQSDDRIDDDYDCIRARINGNQTIKELLEKNNKDKDRLKKITQEATKTWLDVRSFGQVFALKGGEGVDAVSAHVTGPVSVHFATSIDPILPVSCQITKSTSTESGDKRGSDTMGMKHYVPFGLYKVLGSISVQLAEHTGFSDEDAQKIKEALVTLFENDASAARPDGSMVMHRLYWCTHKTKTSRPSVVKVHNSVIARKRAGVETPRCVEDYEFDECALGRFEDDGLRVERFIDGDKI